MNYTDICVLAVDSDKKEEYLAHSVIAAQVFKDYGALSMTECWGDDVPEGEVTSFPMAVKCKPNETVVVSWAVWPSKEVRDKGMQLMMADERMDPANTPIPFDGQRMIFGGFDIIYSV